MLPQIPQLNFGQQLGEWEREGLTTMLKGNIGMVRAQKPTSFIFTHTLCCHCSVQYIPVVYMHGYFASVEYIK